METKPGVQPVEDVRKYVRQRYGKIAADSQAIESCCEPQVQNSDCCGTGNKNSIDLVSKIYEAKDAAELPEEVTGLSLGCGDPVTLAALKPGQTVLDLGSGGGIDCFLAAKRVGENGRVIGIDMTAEMIERARNNKSKLGAENVEFRLGEIEHLPVADGIVDVIISNCVINLSTDKPQVFREAFRVLKPGGKLAVSDIVTDGQLPQAVKDNLSAWAECVGGALDVKDYISAIEAAGFTDVKLKPVYFDRGTVDSVMEQVGMDANIERVVAVKDGGEPGIVELGELEDVSVDSLSKTVFSAKISARKPA
jgi:SAM-dependent methyltransferase